MDTTKLVLAERLDGDTPEDTRLLRQMLQEAKNYITSFSWCRGIREIYFGDGVGKIIALFLFHIIPQQGDIDEWNWVVVGDLPPAYLAGSDSPTRLDALKDYLWLMNEWVTAVKEGRNVDSLIPVNAAPIIENALSLEARLKFLETHILPRFAEAP